MNFPHIHLVYYLTIPIRYHLVMITERLEESLILMKDQLGLRFSDISSFAKNIAAKPNVSKNISESLTRKIEKWQDLDLKLYDYFSQKFEEKVDEFGREKMKKQVEELRNFNRKRTSECIEKFDASEKELRPENRDWVPKGVVLKGFKIFENSSENCHLMALSPMAFVIKLQERQCMDSHHLRKIHHLQMFQKTECDLKILK